jgi:hypothetical protein
VQAVLGLHEAIPAVNRLLVTVKLEEFTEHSPESDPLAWIHGEGLADRSRQCPVGNSLASDDSVYGLTQEVGGELLELIVGRLGVR